MGTRWKKHPNTALGDPTISYAKHQLLLILAVPKSIRLANSQFLLMKRKIIRK